MGVGKNVRLSTKYWPYLGNGKPRLLLITNKKWHIDFQMT